MIRTLHCGVCNESSAVFHFGAQSCNACAAFFRRLVSKNQIPPRRCPGNCDIAHQITRRTCPNCRYAKCLKIGMKTYLVESNASCSTLKISILEELKESYKELIQLRKNTFKNEGSKLVFFEERDAVCAVDFTLALETLIAKFKKLTPVPDDQQNRLIANFVIAFLLADQFYRSIDSNFIILPNGNYLDVDNLDQHYLGSTSDGNKAQEAKKFLGPYWDIGRRLLNRKYKELRIDLSEHVLIGALIFWDFGLPHQSDECTEVCLQKRSEAMKELVEYENRTRSSEEAPFRIAEVMLLLQMVQKGKTMMEEYKTISIVYDLCDKNSPLFHMFD